MMRLEIIIIKPQENLKKPTTEKKKPQQNQKKTTPKNQKNHGKPKADQTDRASIQAELTKSQTKK
jgi:hypothetical protein